MEAKRSAMPRFYFIGDDDLLEILGQANNPNVIQSHLKKLFQGINKVLYAQTPSPVLLFYSFVFPLRVYFEGENSPNPLHTGF